MTDVFSYCRTTIPRWNTISISGYHMAEAGANPAQEVGYTIANGIEYVRAAIASGQDVDEFAPRLAFFFVARTTLLEEVAKFRAARRIWARVMREEFGAKDPKSLMLRFHTQTAGVQLTAQQPEVNLIRVTVQALGALFGGTQSLHTNSYDEAIALPTEKAARLAVRTQQVLANETDITATVDPFAGSYAVESMTDEVEAAALDLMARIEDMGGAVAAIERGYQKNGIEDTAYRTSQQIESGERKVVGVNTAIVPDDERYEPLRVDPTIEEQQAKRLAALRADRDNSAVTRALDELAPRGGRHGQRATPDARRASRPRHGRRGMPCPARDLGRLRACGRDVTEIDQAAVERAASGPAERTRHRPGRRATRVHTATDGSGVRGAAHPARVHDDHVPQ